MPDFVEVFSRIHGRLPGASAIPATATWLSVQEPRMPLGEVHNKLQTLRGKGWIRTVKGYADDEYAGLVVEPVSRALVEAIHALLQAVPGRSWTAAFHADRPVFLDTLHHCESIADAIRIAGTRTSTAYDTTRLMHEDAILVRDRNTYRLNHRVPSLHHAIHEAARVAAIGEIVGERQDTPPFDIVWHQGPEALVTTTGYLDNLEPGGLDAFRNYRLEFATRRKTYFRAKRPLDAADAIFQAIHADPSSAQTRSYAALLYEQEHPESLDDRAAWYRLPDEPQRLRGYVDRRAEVDGYLPQREYDRLKALYGVPTRLTAETS